MGIGDFADTQHRTSVLHLLHIENQEDITQEVFISEIVGMPVDTVKEELNCYEETLDELENRVQQIIDRTPYGETEEVAMPYWEKLWKAVDDGNNYNEFKLNSGNKPQQLDEVIPEQVVEDTAKMVSGETKTRSLPQSVLDAKGTPKEAKEIIKQDMPTYQVMHNQDLIKQATDEIAGNFDNELIIIKKHILAMQQELNK